MRRGSTYRVCGLLASTGGGMPAGSTLVDLKRAVGWAKARIRAFTPVFDGLWAPCPRVSRQIELLRVGTADPGAVHQSKSRGRLCPPYSTQLGEPRAAITAWPSRRPRPADCWRRYGRGKRRSARSERWRHFGRCRNRRSAALHRRRIARCRRSRRSWRARSASSPTPRPARAARHRPWGRADQPVRARPALLARPFRSPQGRPPA